MLNVLKTALFFSFFKPQLNTQTALWLVLKRTLHYSGHFLHSPCSVRRFSCNAVCSIERVMAFNYARCPEWREMFSLFLQLSVFCYLSLSGLLLSCRSWFLWKINSLSVFTRTQKASSFFLYWTRGRARTVEPQGAVSSGHRCPLFILSSYPPSILNVPVKASLTQTIQERVFGPAGRKT